jgi:hypothetical protein
VNGREEYEQLIKYALDFDPTPANKTITIRRHIKEIHPQYVTRTDQTIVAWQDVPEYIQQKVLSGTMTEEDWDSDWGIKRDVEDVISEALCELPVARIGPRHVHVFRKEYPKCLIKGCNAKKGHTY